MESDTLSPEIPPELERYLALAERMFERMMRTGEWPWEDQSYVDDKGAEDAEDVNISDDETEFQKPVSLNRAI